MALNKKLLHHWLVQLRRVKTWHLLAAFVLLAGVSAFLLRQNNLHMIELRNLVMKADEDPNGDTKQALLNLQRYVSTHMNTDLGEGLYLQNSYRRAYDAAVQQAVTATNPNARLYDQVELECRPVFQRTNSFPAYTRCAAEKLSQLAPGHDPLSNLKTPPVDLYHYNFVSPRISFDPAGISVLLTLFVAVLIVMRLVGYAALKLLLKWPRSSRLQP